LTAVTRAREDAAMSPPHVHDLGPFVHSHAFGDDTAPRRERALWQVTWITLATMALELAVGWWSGSLALTADGWHMGTHAVALGGAAFAAQVARRAHRSTRISFCSITPTVVTIPTASTSA